MSAAAAPVPGRASRHRRVFLPILVALSVLAWLVLWAWAASPYGRYLEHGSWTAMWPAVVLCSTVPGGNVVVPVLLYAASWILMTAAMMLPTTLPLFDTFDRLTTGHLHRGRLLLLLGSGYIAVWAAFGVLAHGLHNALLALPALARHGWLVGTAVIALAGAFQFSALKYQCLEKCRSPLSFVTQHWHGRVPSREAFLLGAHHGLFCVGCCWALMLLMFALGTGSLGWMLLLAAVMSIEKNMPWGRRLSAPLGLGLLSWAFVLAASHA
jgi:predicted metal-binding membrane protein